MHPIIFVLVAAGLVVSAVSCQLAAVAHGKKMGAAAERWRMRRLYLTDRVAAEYELLMGVRIEDLHPRLRAAGGGRRRSAWVEAATGEEKP